MGIRLTEYPFQYDDLFLFAPSVAWYEEQLDEGRLEEGKAIGTAPEVDTVFLDKDKTMDAFLRPEAFAKARKSGMAVAKRRFKQLQRRVYDELLAEVIKHDSGRTWDDDFRKAARRIMRKAWKEAFLLGVRASGFVGRGKGAAGAYNFELTADDEKWLRSAMRHEMRFLNKFLNAVTEQSYSMPLPRRTRMYVDALESFFGNARVMGMPATSAYWWVGKKDKRVCASCEYMHKHSPFHKKTLPTVPRTGATLCLTNCRDRLLVRVVGSDRATAILQGSRYTRGGHIKNLREIKRRGELPKRLQ